MATVLKDGLITGTATVSAGDEAMFQEVVEQLAPHCRVRLDPRRFTEVTIDGPGWSHKNDWHMQHFALRLVSGRVTFDCGFGHDNRVMLEADSWLYVPLSCDFFVTTGRAAGDYPCLFIVAQLEVQ